ncbi:MAG: hypothetical protein KJZ70_02610 [Bryobacterales bacterium]|nr:hypothetical protein [Bryobacterales bacterium]
MKNICTFLFFLLAAGAGMRPALAQKPISIGVRAGVPLTDLIEADERSDIFSGTRHYTFGPTVSVNFPAGISVQADALYKRFSFGRPGGFVGNFPAKDTAGNSWEFPVMLKWTAPGKVAPFVNAGASFRNWSGFDQIGNFVTGQNFDEVDDSKNVGFVAGGGLAIKLGAVRISPEIRFTRWGTNNFADGVKNLLETNRNQAEVLVGFTF